MPSPRTFWICLIVGSIINLAASIGTYTNPEYSPLIRLSWVIPDLFHGLTYSLGLALIVHATRYRTWSTLMPGHWRLIAFLSTWFIYAGLFAPPLAALVVYLAFALISKERLVWRIYAWLCVIAFGLELSQTIFMDLYLETILANFSESSQSDTGIANSPILMVYMAMSLLQPVMNLAAFVMLVAGVATDFHAKIRRDAYHYLGLILVMVLPITQWIWQLLASGAFDQLNAP